MLKKLLLGIMLIGFLTGPAFAQTITENLDVMDTELRQASDLMSGLGVMRDGYENAVSTNTKVQALVDAGQFNQIPLNVRQALNRAWIELKAYIAAVEADAEIMEAFQWKP